MANRNDVAKKAGVSGATVSRVFNNPASVAAETRQKVLKVAEELNYHPNIIASNFVKRRSGNIGVIMPHFPRVHIFSVYYFSELLSGIGETIQKQGYNLMLFFHQMQIGKDNDYLPYFRVGNVDGCILLGTLNNDRGLLRLQDKGYKFCLINNYIKNSGISFADVDNVSGSCEAVRHLINLGHRHIVFLNGPSFYTNSMDRLEGYKKALEEADIPFKKQNVIQGNYGRKSGYETTEIILELKEKPTAVFAANDRMAAGLMQGLKQKGVKIPEDISIAGYDDSDTAVLVEPRLTTVRIPFFELGKQCAQEFISILREERKTAFNLFLTPELVVRESTQRQKK